ncbi:glycosyl transferase family 1 [Candidatus Kuenenbacteria bacterium CG10_big_fil_rev_8_21_14_0_10_36_11]|uniref:Glycosyl transferase family 1 n=1 Tax=Candidatus Kuenenbacteria bacterium CG10_big_fil_rev_8_21_14_0_10_36_11 TaxID=1974618 RepID=A0A2M6WBK2_9BACT|nr:MAG: glycosyl transferase family 1 [Candidatus Kuenenbacteria bacterium CG10_big_fil_rev_8_21_14_0_10_36_11]
MKLLILYEHPASLGSMSTQGQLLYQGLKENGIECYPAHYQERAKEREFFYRAIKPDVVIGIGWWADTPQLIREPQKFNILPVPWLLSDGWVANYHSDINALPLVFVTSFWVKETYKRDMVDVKNFEVLHVGYDPKLFRPLPKDQAGVREVRRMFGVKDDEKMILTMGGDTTSKGAQEMIVALAKVNQQFKNWKYVCKSTTSACAHNHHEEELNLMDKLGLPKDKIVYVTDDFSREMVPFLLNAANIYAAPSRIEGFGMIQVEAMACGTPVISIDAMGPKDTIVHGETGFLAKVGGTVELTDEWVNEEMGFDEAFKVKFEKPKIFAYRADIDELADYTLKLLTDEKLAREMGEKAARHALENFDYKKLARHCLNILQEKLNLK